MNERKTIRLNSPGLQEIAAQGGNFNQRVAEVVDRYTLLLNMTDLPEFTDREKVALGELLLSAELTRSKIKGLALDAEDIGPEFLTPDEKQTLIDKLRPLSPAQVIKLLESLENIN